MSKMKPEDALVITQSDPTNYRIVKRPDGKLALDNRNNAGDQRILRRPFEDTDKVVAHWFRAASAAVAEGESW
jgi:hypothetical protein